MATYGQLRQFTEEKKKPGGRVNTGQICLLTERKVAFRGSRQPKDREINRACLVKPAWIASCDRFSPSTLPQKPIAIVTQKKQLGYPGTSIWLRPLDKNSSSDNFLLKPTRGNKKKNICLRKWKPTWTAKLRSSFSQSRLRSVFGVLRAWNKAATGDPGRLDMDQNCAYAFFGVDLLNK